MELHALTVVSPNQQRQSDEEYHLLVITELLYRVLEVRRVLFVRKDAEGEERAAETDRKQDGMCSARVRRQTWTRLREGTRGDAGGKDRQSLHVQLGSKVDEHGHTAD